MREKLKEDLFDYGVAGYKEYIDSNGAIKARTINPRNILINHCKNKDFSDAAYVGEIIEMSISDLKQMAGDTFSASEYEDIAKNVGLASTAILGSGRHLFQSTIKVMIISVSDFWTSSSSPLMRWYTNSVLTDVEIKYTLVLNTKKETNAKTSSKDSLTKLHTREGGS